MSSSVENDDLSRPTCISTTNKQCPSWPTGREVMTTSSCWVRGYNSTPSPTVQSTPVNRTVERDSAVSGRKSFWAQKTTQRKSPVGQEGHCFLVVDLHSGHVQSLTGMVT